MTLNCGCIVTDGALAEPCSTHAETCHVCDGKGHTAPKGRSMEMDDYCPDCHGTGRVSKEAADA